MDGRQTDKQNKEEEEEFRNIYLDLIQKKN